MTDAPEYADLPVAVREHVVAVAAECLPSLATPPAALKRVAAFAPQRRARLGGPAIEAALADDEFRERIGTQALAREWEHPLDEVATAWLARTEGWEEVVAAVEVDTPTPAPDPERLAALTSKLASAERTAKEARARAKAQTEELKTENTRLRRALGEERAAARAARAAEAAAVATAEAARAALAAEQSASAASTRRLKQQLDQVQAQLAAARRDDRAGRDQATVRARLLLDTLLDSAAGLRRELGLPSTAAVPADSVEMTLAEPGERTPSGLQTDTPAALEQLLGLPRARLIIDGYNVTRQAWPSASLEQQRNRLVRGLAALAARTRAETTVVFDGHSAEHRPMVTPPRGVRVAFSPEGVIADDLIRQLVDAEPQGRPVVVVTDDREVVTDVTRAGARVAATPALVALLGG